LKFIIHLIKYLHEYSSPHQGGLSSSPFFNCEAWNPRGFQLWFGLTSPVEVMGPPEWSLLASTVEVCGEENFQETGDV